MLYDFKALPTVQFFAVFHVKHLLVVVKTGCFRTYMYLRKLEREQFLNEFKHNARTLQRLSLSQTDTQKIGHSSID